MSLLECSNIKKKKLQRNLKIYVKLINADTNPVTLNQPAKTYHFHTTDLYTLFYTEPNSSRPFPISWKDSGMLQLRMPMSVSINFTYITSIGGL